MTRKRRVLGAAFKANVSLEAIKGDKTTVQLASEFGVHTGQITTWKKQLLSNANEQELYEQIGRLKMEVEWLKKVSDAGLKPEVLGTWIEPNHSTLSVSRQCDLLGLARSSWYYGPCGETERAGLWTTCSSSRCGGA